MRLLSFLYNRWAIILKRHEIKDIGLSRSSVSRRKNKALVFEHFQSILLFYSCLLNLRSCARHIIREEKMKGFISKKVLLMTAFIMLLCSCTSKPKSIDKWKAWVLTKADVEDYSAMDLVDQYADEREGAVKYVDYHEEFEQWWFEQVENKLRGDGELYTESDNWFHLEQERKDFNDYYQTLAEMTLMNALCYNENDNVEEKFAEDFGFAFARLLGDEFALMQWYERVEEKIDLDNLDRLTRMQLKETMIEVIGDRNSSLYKCALATIQNNEDRWWKPADIADLAREHQDEFFTNVMAFWGDFSELIQAIDETVGVYSCDYNSELSTGKADVYDVIYSINDKMYVRCSILESEGTSEIKIINKSTHLLSL